MLWRGLRGDEQWMGALAHVDADRLVAVWHVQGDRLSGPLVGPGQDVARRDQQCIAVKQGPDQSEQPWSQIVDLGLRFLPDEAGADQRLQQSKDLVGGKRRPRRHLCQVETMRRGPENLEHPERLLDGGYAIRPASLLHRGPFSLISPK